MSKAILTSVSNGVLTITINRPEAKNAINKAAADGIASALIELDKNHELKVAVITGAEGGFSSGMDLKAFLTGELPMVEGRGFAGIAEAKIEKPVIAAVEGFALAGGFEIMLSCDLVVAANDVKLGIPEVKRGLVAAGGGLIRMPQQMPKRLAMEMALTGNPISAQRGYEVGLINRVTEKGKALAEAQQLAAEISKNGPLAIAVSKDIINTCSDWSQDEMFTEQAKLVMPVLSSSDAQEGPLAFAEKRAPKWTGT